MVLEEILKKEKSISMEPIDTHKCRFMGEVNTYDINLLDKDFKYTKSVLHKEYGGACILPFDKDGNVILEIQYRFPIRQAIIELPAGRLDENESFFECAKRELREETGCISENIVEMPSFFAQPEFTDEKLGGFIALNCEEEGEQKLDSDESVCVLRVPFKIAVEMVKRNIIIDERTIIAIGEAIFLQKIGVNNIDSVDDYINNICNKLKCEEKNLEKKDIDVDYTEICEFGIIQDHIVKVPGNKNSRRECFYLKAGDIVLPVSKTGKIGVIVSYMPSVRKNMVQLPNKVQFDGDIQFVEFGEMVTAIGYANDRQYMFLAENCDETNEFIWLTKEEVFKYIENGNINDGRVLAIIFKYFCQHI